MAVGVSGTLVLLEPVPVDVGVVQRLELDRRLKAATELPEEHPTVATSSRRDRP